MKKNNKINRIKIDSEIFKDIFMFNLLSSKSPVLYHYYEKTKLWDFVEDLLNDIVMIKIMIMNQNLNIAPLHTMLEYYDTEIDEIINTKFYKQCLGSIVSLIFVSLGYKKYKQKYKKDAIIKYASIFKYKED